MAAVPAVPPNWPSLVALVLIGITASIAACVAFDHRDVQGS
jgi:hypothetical protein